MTGLIVLMVLGSMVPGLPHVEGDPELLQPGPQHSLSAGQHSPHCGTQIHNYMKAHRHGLRGC